MVSKAKHACSSHRYYIRFFFRIFEISSRLFVYCLIWTNIDGLVLFVIVIIHLLHNVLLFYGGCLGREPFNIFGFVIFIPKLNKTLQEGKVHSILENNFYIKFYRNSEFEQTKMIVVRSVELLLYCIAMLVYALMTNNIVTSQEISKIGSTEQVEFIMFSSQIIMIFLTPLFWFLMFKLDIIDFAKKKEQISFSTIYKAIELDRLDPIIENFNSIAHLTGIRKNDTRKQTPLHYVCAKNRRNIMDWMLLESGHLNEKDINALDGTKQSIIFYCCAYGALDCLIGFIEACNKLEYDYKAAIIKCNSRNQNILHTSCKNGHSKIVEYLLENVLSDDEIEEMITKKTDSRDGYNSETPLHHACGNGDKLCVELLINHEKCKDKMNEDLFNCVNEQGKTAVELAVMNQYFEISQILIKDSRFKMKQRQLTNLWTDCVVYDDANAMKLLYNMYRNGDHDKKEEKEEKEKEKKNNNVFNVLTPIVSRFRSSDNNYNINRLEAPLFIASRNNSGDVIRFVLNIDNSNVNDVDSLGYSALYIACMNGNEKATQALIECDKTDLFFRQMPDKNLILMGVCQGGSKTVFNIIAQAYLTKYDKNKLQRHLNRENIYGQSSIFFACKYNNHQLLRLICHEFEINLLKKDKNGKTPKDIAKEAQHDKTVREITWILKMAD